MKQKTFTFHGIDATQGQHDFARAFVFEPTAVKAYMVAYPTSKRSIAKQSAHNLMKRDNVLDLIEYYRGEKSKMLDISEASILAELGAIGFANIADVITNEGDDFTAPDEWSLKSRKAVGTYATSTTYDRDGNPCVKKTVTMHSKIQALKLLAEIKGIGQIHDSGNVTVNIRRGALDE